ncbi:MAG TPA: asparagine synthase (glutamine-hydrolyzing) [Gemmataceae bacterium]|nr:asparagine synthase (glutamine-hydrolyzing) [Gemmataceae bacterium]
MCGILGIVGQRIERDCVAHVAATMRHRGPDASGIRLWEDGALAHCRLSILDPSAAANQPFVDSLGRAALVYNGEIYNYRELRKHLEARGHLFRTASDTEVLLAGYLEWGEHCVDHLNGMFAFAVWDYRTHSLFLARDRFGKKPLFYALLRNGCLIFASEIKPFLASGLVDSRVDAEALVDYLHLNYVLCPKTPLRQVRQLPAAHVGTWRDGHWSARPYWDLADSFLADRWSGDEGSTIDRLDELLMDATRQRLRSDVPLGAFLSGGVDSSTVVATMRRAGAADLHTFSVEFPEPEFNEGGFARRAADHLETIHHPHLVEESLVDILPEYARRMDVPLGDDSAISTYLLSRWARQHVTVALSGDGADELFAGYSTYQADALHHRLGPLRRPAAWLLCKLGPYVPESGAKLSRRFRAAQLGRGLALPAELAHVAWRQVGSRAGTIAPDLQRENAGYDPSETFRQCYARVPDADWLDRMLYVDCQTWLRDDILVKVDRASMAASLECRAPFLDYRIAEFAARLPRRLKLRGSEKKRALCTLARRFLPAEIVDRKKSGFNSPTTNWLRGTLRTMAEDLFASGALESLGLSWRPHLETRWNQFQRGRREHQYGLWGLFCLALWQRHVLAGWQESAGGEVHRNSA